MAARRRRALEALREIGLEVESRGPEGEQIAYDEKGKRITTKARTEYVGFQGLLRELQIEAGVVDVELERLVDDIKAHERFFGEASPGMRVLED